MIYKINGIPVDIYGEMPFKWSMEDKISIVDFVSMRTVGDQLMIEYYRKGTPKKTTIKLIESVLPPIRKMYPGYETIAYEVIGGITVMPLTLNHIVMLAQYAPDLVQYANINKHTEPVLLITNVMIDSPASRARVIGAGMIISEVNGIKVKTIDDFRQAVLKSAQTGYLTIKNTDNIFAAIPLKDLLNQEERLANLNQYQPSLLYKQLTMLAGNHPIQEKNH